MLVPCRGDLTCKGLWSPRQRTGFHSSDGVMLSIAYSEMQGLRWGTSIRGLIFGSPIPNVPLTRKSGSPLVRVGTLHMLLPMSYLAAISPGPSPWGGIGLLI